jgi:hypothetical protein
MKGLYHKTVVYCNSKNDPLKFAPIHLERKARFLIQGAARPQRRNFRIADYAANISYPV